MSCVERLEMPVYPPLARAAHITGAVATTVTASADGLIHVSFSQSAHPLLTTAVENALHLSVFRKDCAGKSIKVIFNFVIDAKSDPSRSARISFGYPDQFWISVPTPVMNF
jgi:hypothetical protein